MPRGRDIVGDKFGRLEVIEHHGYAPVSKNSKARRKTYKCKCDCGKEVIVNRNALLSNNTKSCGCLQKEHQQAPSLTHGLHKHRLYKTWENMKTRCNNPNNHHYKYYGGKGVKLCREWEDNFVSFYEWAIENGWKKGLTIERLDNSKGYYPENCKWISMKDQYKNKTSNVYVEIRGERKSIAEWCKIYNVSRTTVSRRRKEGKSGEELFLKRR